MSEFQEIEKPRLIPLEKSFAVDESEEELKRLFINLFRANLSEKTSDVNVSGMAHLGSFDLVRRTVNSDGLALLQGDREEEATRYLYRAWLARDVDGRGLYFIRTYLQLLFPNLCQVEQCWQAKDTEYPYGLKSPLDDDVKDGSTVIDPEKYWLTSRIELALDLTVATRPIKSLASIFRAILPARLVPRFRFWLVFELIMHYEIEYSMLMQKESEALYPWASYYICNPGDRDLWYLGDDDEPQKAIKLDPGFLEAWIDFYKFVEIPVFSGYRYVCNPGDRDLWYLGDDDNPKPSDRLADSQIEGWLTIGSSLDFRVEPKMEKAITAEKTCELWALDACNYLYEEGDKDVWVLENDITPNRAVKLKSEMISGEAFSMKACESPIYQPKMEFSLSVSR